MSKYLKGQKVRFISDCNGEGKGTVAEIAIVRSCGVDVITDQSFGWGLPGDLRWSVNYPEEYLEIINDNKTKTSMGNIIDKVRQMRLKEPEKSFVKAGIANTDGTLTKEGEQLFNEWMFEKNKADFNKGVVQPLLAEIEAEKE